MAARGVPSARRGPRLPITRESTEAGFDYRLNGKLIRRGSEIKRITALAIPPAWGDVEIARSPTAKVLARGVDAAGRVQRIYHPSYRRRQDRRKFARVQRFGRALPRLRARIDRDLRRRRLSAERVTACVVHLIDVQFFRIGNPEYARQHRSYGVTTLLRDHVTVTGSEISFAFTGKSGKRHRRRVRDERVARLLTRIHDELPGPELFSFLDDGGTAQRVHSAQVNDYVRRYMGEEFSAKDFRTWGGTVHVATAVLTADAEVLGTQRSRDTLLRGAITEAAMLLGNTPAVTKSAYVDPRVLHAIEHPRILQRVRAARSRMRPRRYLDINEQSTLALLTAMERTAIPRGE